MNRALLAKSFGFASVVVGLLLAAPGARAAELPRPTYANSVFFSISHDLTDTATVDLLKAEYGGGLYVELGFSIFGAPLLGWHAPLASADSDPAALYFRSQVDGYVGAAAASGVNLHIILSDSLSRALDVSHEAKVEDVRNAQWYNSNNLVPGSTPPSTDAMDSVIFGTFSRYARKLQQHEDAKWHAAFRYLATVIAANPSMTIVISAPGEAELNFNGTNDSTSLQAVFCDYSPFTVLEFRDWITHDGLYAPGGRYDGQGWVNGGAKYQGDSGLDQFNHDFGTAFSTWDLKYFNWSLSDPFDVDNTDTTDVDPHCIPFSNYVHGGMMPTSAPGLTSGGFDPPRVMLAKGTSLFWDLWQTFRETLVYHHVHDIIAIANAEGIPADRLFTHQIPGDYLFGTYPNFPGGNNNRYYSGASPLWTADQGALAGVGVTCYDVHFPDFYARTSQYLLGALVARSTNLALMEYNPEVLPDGLPVTIAPASDIYNQMMRTYTAGVHFVNFFLWSGSAEWAYQGTLREVALQSFFAAIKDRARQPVGTVFSPPVVGGLSGAYDGARSQIVLSWSPQIWQDLSYRWDQWGDFGTFTVCRGTTPDFPCNLTTRIAQTKLFGLSDTTFNWPGPVYYKVAARNSLGTIGPVAATVVTLPATAPSLSVNHSSLYFGATNGGTVRTSGQSVMITISGATGVAWTATSNNPAFVVSPVSGSGSGTVTVSMAAGAASSTSGTVTITAPGVPNSPQPISTRYTVYGAAAGPFGVMDTPVEGTQGVVGSIGVTGWALDDVEVGRVEIWRDPVGTEPVGANGHVYIGVATFVSGARPDVEAAYPGVPWGYRAGWGYMLLTNMLPNGGNGAYRLYAYAVDVDGHQTLLGSRGIGVANATAVKPFGTIDTPGQGATVSGSAYVNFGWALTPQPGAIAVDGSTITVWIDGQPMGHPVYNNYRSDIATLFPGLANSNGAVGYYVIDTTTLTNGMHNIAWSVTDNLDRTEGIGSRYFWVLN